MPIKFPVSKLSMHAEARLAERFSIGKDDLLYLLNAAAGIKIGVSKESHVIHRLVWSQIDCKPIIAIQDIISGDVITFLTSDMYKRDYGSKLTDKIIEKAINQLRIRGLIREEITSGDNYDVGKGSLVIVAYFEVDDPSVFAVRYRALGKYDKAKIPEDGVQGLERSAEFWGWVDLKIEKKDLQMKTISAVVARYEKGGSRYYLNR